MSEFFESNFKNFSEQERTNRLKQLAYLSIILVLIFFTRFFNYLLFHSISELFSIVIAGGTFLIGWNSRRYMENSFFLVLGVSFLFVGVLDLIHTIGYKGMGILMNASSNLPTQLWISARFLQAFSFISSFFFLNKKIKPEILVISYTFITAALFLMIFTGIFPDCYSEPTGLTLFKIVSEYVIISIFLSSIILLYHFRKEFDREISYLLFGAFIIFSLSEFSFTLYLDVYGIFNLIGHLLKITGFFFIYLAIIETGFRNPFDLLFRKLKTQEERIKAERDILLNIFDGMTDKIYIVNQYYKITYANPSFIKEFGEIKTRTCYKYLHNRDSPCSDCKFPQIMKGNVARWEWHAEKRDKYYDHIDTPIRGIEGHISKLAILRDITDMKKTQENLKSFVSTVSHELKNPIAVLSQTIEMIDQYGNQLQGDGRERLMDIMSKNSKLMAELIEDLLVLSKIDDKRSELDIERYNLRTILENTLQKLNPLLKNKKLNVDLKIGENIFLYGDTQKLEQIFRILIDNAIKYSYENSEIKIDARDNYEGEFNPEKIGGVLVSFTDTGRGISEKDLPHIFERFYRSEKVKEITGTGLGLAIAKELLDLHEGKIYVETEYGKGTTFHLLLPKNLKNSKR
jgi:signal transduction histidine kinase